MAQALAAKLGIGVGISSGANFLGALKLLEELGHLIGSGDAVLDSARTGAWKNVN